LSRPVRARKPAASPATTPKIRVAFVVTPRFTLTAFAGFVDVLRLAADDGDRSRQVECHWTVLGDPGRPVVSSSGAEVRPWEPMEAPERFDYIVVVGGLLQQGQRAPARTIRCTAPPAATSPA
jgi:transcriptional regulator GlxA family with amidase domain